MYFCVAGAVEMLLMVRYWQQFCCELDSAEAALKETRPACTC